MDGDGDSIDPYVKLCLTKKVKLKTSVIKRAAYPVWLECFQFAVDDPSAVMLVKVKSRGLFSGETLGSVSLPLRDLVPHVEQCVTLVLRDSTGKTADGALGRVLLSVAWLHRLKPSTGTLAGSIPAFTSALSMAGVDASEETQRRNMDDSDIEDAPQGDEDDDLSDDTRARKAKARAEREKKKKERNAKTLSQKELKSRAKAYQDLVTAARAPVSIKPGDWTVQVHVIQVTDLKGEDASGLSDPVVYVEMHPFGLRRNTRVVKATTACVFDDNFFFNVQNMTVEQFEDAHIKVSVFDADTLSRNDLIGSWQVDLSTVYFMPEHEVYQQWVGLVDEKSTSDHGLQGFLQLSVTVLGPGDAPPVHTNTGIMDVDAEAPSGVPSLSSLVMMPPSVKQDLHMLVVTVHKVVDFPKQLGSSVRCSVLFAGNPACTTRTRKAKGGDRLAVNFDEQLWVPVMVPTMTHRITFHMTGAHGNSCAAYFNFKDLQLLQQEQGSAPSLKANSQQRASKLNKWMFKSRGPQDTLDDKLGVGPVWLPLYGAPVRSGVGKVLSDRFSEARRLMNRFPDNASFYRGSALLSLRIDYNTRLLEDDHIHTKPVKPMPDSVLAAKSTMFTLAAMVVSGSGIPTLRGVTGASKLSVRVSFGSLSLDTLAASNSKGEVRWDQMLRFDGLPMPTNPVEMPDVFVYLMKGSKAVCYARVDAADVLASGWDGAYQWVSLERDAVLDAVSERQFPGAVLLRLGLGPTEGAPMLAWEADVEDALAVVRPYELQVHVFQARNLPATNDDGTCNPYVTATCAGRRAATRKQRNSLHPVWYQSLRLDVEILPHHFRPSVMVEAFDHDRLGRDVQFGRLALPLKDAFVGAGAPPPPKWHTLSLLTSNTNAEEVGIMAVPEVLLALQLVPKDRPTDAVPVPLPILPDTRPAFIEVTLVGLRGLVAPSFHMLQKCQVVLSAKGPCSCSSGSCSRCRPYESPAVRKPNVRNPNYLQRVVMPVNLPVAPIALNPLSVTVRDIRLGGLVKSIIGIGTIDLSTKVPWFPEYEAPCQQRRLVGPEVEDEEFYLLPGERPNPATSALQAEDAVDTGAGVAFMGAGAASGSSANPAPSPPRPASRRASTQRSGGSTVASGDGDDPEVDVQSVLSWAKSGDDGPGMAPSVASSVTRRSNHPPKPPRPKKQRRVVSFAKAKSGLDPSVGADTAPAVVRMSQASTRRRDAARSAQTWTMPTPQPFDLLPPYLSNRRLLTGGVEDLLVTAPFESYPVYRGKAAWGDSLLGFTPKASVRTTGSLKCVVRVLESASVEPLFDLEHLFRPQAVVVRVYVLRGFNLQPKDRNGKCDPFLRLKLGPHVVKGKHVASTLNPSFHQYFDFNVVLPGYSKLEIDVLDRDLITPDELVGTTVIDLEDRFFDSRWHALGTEDCQDGELPKRPVEYRPLFSPKSLSPQGSIEMWLDILTPEEAAAHPPIDVALPPPEDFEVRVVVWRTRDVVAMMYARAWMEGSRPQETDIHWRCRGGAGSFNWRMKFNVQYPSQFPFLHLQLWDKDIIGANDCIGSVGVDLTAALKRAFMTKQAVPLFNRTGPVETKADPEAKKAARREAIAKARAEREKEASPAAVVPDDEVRLTVNDDGDSLKEPLLGKGKQDDGYGSADDAKATAGGARRQSNRRLGDAANAFVNRPRAMGDTRQRRSTPGEDKDKAKRRRRRASKSKKKKKLTAAEKEAQKRADAKDFVRTIKNLLGLGQAEDAAWLTVQRADEDDVTIKDDMGEVLVSIEVLPKAVAAGLPNGKGRSNPNMHPFLPPPVGRIKWLALWNPLYLLRVLCGPQVVRVILCCLCLVVFLYIMVLFGPIIMEGVTFGLDIIEFPPPFDKVFGIFVATIVGCCCCCICAICCKLRMMCKRLCGGGGKAKKEEEEEEEGFSDLDSDATSV